MDKLEEMFKHQDKLQQKLGTWEQMKTETDKQLFINLNLLALYGEIDEIMRETNWKKTGIVPFGWKKNQEFNRKKYVEEIIDAWHFMMNLCLTVGVSPEEFYDIYCEKNAINIQRQEENY